MTFWEAASLVLNAGWQLLASIVYPGTGMSFASILIGSMCAVISLRFIGYVLGLRFDVGGASNSIRNFNMRDARKNDSRPDVGVASRATINFKR